MTLHEMEMDESFLDFLKDGRVLCLLVKTFRLVFSLFGWMRINMYLVVREKCHLFL